ncbi:hypothetical protein VUR80DRAFT_9646 [Thermomyces stellatus]
MLYLRRHLRRHLRHRLSEHQEISKADSFTCKKSKAPRWVQLESYLPVAAGAFLFFHFLLCFLNKTKPLIPSVQNTHVRHRYFFRGSAGGSATGVNHWPEHGSKRASQLISCQACVTRRKSAINLSVRTSGDEPSQLPRRARPQIQPKAGFPTSIPSGNVGTPRISECPGAGSGAVSDPLPTSPTLQLSLLAPALAPRARNMSLARVSPDVYSLEFRVVCFSQPTRGAFRPTYNCRARHRCQQTWTSSCLPGGVSPRQRIPHCGIR